MIKICVLTATRAEYGLLAPIIKKMKKDDTFDVKVVVTGAHLSPEFSLTYREIEADGVCIHKKIEMLLSADTSSAISKSMGLALISFADYFAENSFDYLMVLGDRYETLAVCCAAMNARIPIVHIHGGETTEGAIDEAIRHAITKMSYIHFTSTETYRQRVIQLGEEPNRVFCVGAMGVENARSTQLMTKVELAKELQMDLSKKYAVFTFHPVTLESFSSTEQMKEIFKAMDKIDDIQFLITESNADMEGRVINEMLKEYSGKNSNIRVFSSLGMKKYLSAIKYSEFVIGNSSSGIIEAPSFGIPTVDIGLRQKGRIAAESVIKCDVNSFEIINAINKARSKTFREKIKNVINPYGDGNTSEKIVRILKEKVNEGKFDLKKKFYDII